VASLASLLDMTEALLAKGAVGLFLKGQDVDSELTDSTKCWRIDIGKKASRTEAGGTVLIVKRAQRVSRPRQPD